MNLFSKAQKANKPPEPLRYDLPDGLRTQIVRTWEKGFGPAGFANPGPSMAYERVYNILCDEHQLFELPHVTRGNPPLGVMVAEYFINLQDVDLALDVIQVVFTVMHEMVHRTPTAYGFDAFASVRTSPMEIAEELNRRFKENNVGYHFYQGQIIKQGSQFTHAEIVEPALLVLNEPYLAGANQEFLNANEHFRHGRYKECLNDCLKSFESTMKAICTKRKWLYDANRDTASALIQICLTNGLFPAFLQTQLTSVRTALESGVPTARNKTSGHGQGPNITSVPEDFARYVMNLTATNIRLLADSDTKLS